MKTLKTSDIMNLTEGLLYCAQHHEDFRCFNKCPYKQQDRNMFCQTDMKLNAAEKIAELMIIIQGLIAENEKLKNELSEHNTKEQEHPTFKDVLLKAFPGADIDLISHLICVRTVFPYIKPDAIDCAKYRCYECWDQPYHKEEGGEEWAI